MDSYNKVLKNETLDEITQDNIDFVITKFVAKGFDKLSLEDLAVTLVTPDFASVFKKRTGSEWNSRLQIKTIERLSNAKFDINWMTRKTEDGQNPFFILCSRGDINKVLEFFRKSPDDLRNAIDPTMKTGLHLAAREGHTALVEILIQKGFNVNARDRTLKTPLHYACLYGHEVIADVLLKNKADINARDVSGRTAFHYACAGVSPRIITLLLGTKPELVNDPDHNGRTGLFYAIYNSSQKQVDIIRTILEHKADINYQDESGRTALHHASESGRSRAIPILVQKGADIGIREHVTNKTALDLAANDRVRELIIVYSAAPYRAKEEDLRWMDQAIRGEKPVVKTDKHELKDLRSPPTSTVQQKPEDKMIIPNFLRDKLYEIMKQIQEYGVLNAQHIKRPYIFTGSWMEGVRSVEDFHDKLIGINPLEAAIRVFNMLFPYDKPYPEPKGDEPILSSFFGDVWNFDAVVQKGGEYEKVVEHHKKEQEKRMQSNAEIILSQKLAEQEEETFKVQKEKEILQRQVEELKSKLAKAQEERKLSETIKQQLSEKDAEIKRLLENEKLLKREIHSLNIELKALQETQADPQVEELEKALNKIAELEDQIRQFKEKDKVIRFKAGQVFLKALEERGSSRNYLPREIDINLRDDRALVKLGRLLKDNPPGLKERLTQEDKDRDGKLTQTEFSKAFQKLKMSPKDIISLCRIAGFYHGKDLVSIQEFFKTLQERPKLREKWEEELFFKLIASFKTNGVDFDNAFKIIDSSGDGKVTLVELQEGFEKFGIKLNDKEAYAIFDIFDDSDDGYIELEEFKTVLLEYQQLAQSKGITGTTNQALNLAVGRF